MNLIIWLICLSGLALGKSITTTISISKQNRWAYLSKFSLGPEIGYWQLRAKLLNPQKSELANITLEALAHIDYQWDSLNQLSLCNLYDSHNLEEKSLTLPPNGDWTDFIHGELARDIYPHMWYFTISACNSTLQWKLKVKVEMIFKTEGGSHLPYETYILAYFYPGIAILFAIALIQAVINLQNYIRQTDKIEKSWFLICLIIGVELIGNLAEIIHLWVYSYDGNGIDILLLLSQLCEFLSQLLFMTLLILIATGWGIKYDQFPESETYLPVGMLFLFIYIVIIGYSKVNSEDPSKVSIHDGMPGAVLNILRLFLWVFFLYCSVNLFQQSKARTRSFVVSFAIFSSLYFLAAPFFVVFSWQIPKYHRCLFITTGTLCANLIGNLLLLYQFSTKGTYYRISNLSNNVLPGKDL